MIRVFEAFTGYGGLASFPLMSANISHKIVGWSEIDKYAIQCYQQNFPKYKDLNYGDITKINPNDLPDFDLFTGGFPCQSFSIAGKRKGFEDTRGTLIFDVLRICKVKQPKYILLENVKGLVNHDKGQTLKVILDSLREIGYQIAYKVLNTKDYGIPQNRERIFIVAFRNDIYKPFMFQFPHKEELKLKLKDILEDDVDDKYYLKPEQEEKLLKSLRHTSALQKEDYSYTLASRDYKEPKCVSCAVRQRDRHGKNEKKEQQLELNTEDYANSLTSVQKDSMICYNNYEMSNRVYDVNGICPTLTQVSGDNQEKKILVHDVYNHKINNNDYATTLRTNFSNGNTQILDLYNKKSHSDRSPTLTDPIHNSLRLYTNKRIRKLTPIECFRLQGFINTKIDLSNLSDTQCYRLAGNGVSINVTERILKNLFKEMI